MITCRGCTGSDLGLVFEMEPMPLAGTFPATMAEALAAPRYPLAWLSCHDCGLVNVEPSVPEALIFDGYSYSASTVPALVRHHAGLAAYLTGNWHGAVRVLEIGCNDGVLLNQLPQTWDRVGVDPSDVAARAATNGWTLVNERFTSDLAAGLGGFDVVTTSNSLAHFDGIADALEGVTRCLRLGGELLIEVHDLDETLRRVEWDTIYHEHRVEWSADSLVAVVEPLGFSLVHLWRLPLHGGLLRASFRHHGRRGRRPPAARRNFRPLRVAYEHRRAPWLPRGSVGYGAAARASVYLNQLSLELGYVVDGSPLRHGRFIAGRGIPIVPPAVFERDDPPAVLITAWNHADDIEARHPAYAGRWVTAWTPDR